MRLRRFAFSASLVAILSSWAARAQDVPPKAESGNAAHGPAEEIIVTGQRIPDEPSRDQASRFIRAIAAPPVEGQYARWNEPVCPAVLGIERKAANFVTARIGEIAREAGRKTGIADCRPNLVVTFTPDAPDLMARIYKRDQTVFRGETADERKSLMTGSMPVRWWYRTTSEGADGRPISGESAALLSTPLPSNGRSRYLDSYHNSLIDTKLRISMASVAVVVDVTKATGVRLDALAAYVAFVALARTKMTRNAVGAPTILGLFSGDRPRDRPRGLTAWDRAYLTALYKVPVNRPAHVQRSAMATAMAKAMDAD